MPGAPLELVITFGLPILEFSFSYNDLGVTQSLHGNVYKVVNYEGKVTDVCHAL